MIERRVVRHEELPLQGVLHHGMPPVPDDDALVPRDGGPHVPVFQRRPGEAREAVRRGHGPGRLLHVRDGRADGVFHFLINAQLQLFRLFLRGERLHFKFLQLGRDVALGVRQGLLPREIRRDGQFIRMGNLEIIPEDVVEADLHLDAGLLFFLLFQIGDPLAAVFRERPQLVQLLIVPGTDILPVADIARAVFVHGPVQQVVHLPVEAHLLIETREQERPRAAEEPLDLRHHRERRLQGEQVLRRGGIRLDAGQDALEVEDAGEELLHRLQLRGVAREVLHRVLPEDDGVHIRERPLEPPPEKARPHGGIRVVQHFEERPLASAVAHILRDFQIAQHVLRERERAFLPERRHHVDHGRVRFHHVPEVGREARKGPAHRLVPDARRFRRHRLSRGVVRIPARQEARPETGRAVRLDAAVPVVRHGAHRLRRAVHGEHVEEIVRFLLRVPHAPPALARGNIRHHRAEPPVFLRHIDEIIVRLIRDGIFKEDRPRRDHPDDLPLHEPFRLLRVFHLLADGHAVALLNEAVNIRLRRVIRHAAHGGALVVARVAPGERQLQLARRRHRVVVKHFIEIAQPEKKERVGIALLHGPVLVR